MLFKGVCVDLFQLFEDKLDMMLIRQIENSDNLLLALQGFKKILLVLNGKSWMENELKYRNL